MNFQERYNFFYNEFADKLRAHRKKQTAYVLLLSKLGNAKENLGTTCIILCNKIIFNMDELFFGHYD